MRRDLYQSITDQIVSELEKGVRPWHKPWSGGNLDGRAVLPLRHNGIAYRGVNILALWMAALANGYRSPTIQQMTLGATGDGRLTAVRHVTTSHTSMFDEFVEPCGLMTEMMYSCPNVEVSHRIVRVNVGTPTFTRAPGEASGSFALESAMDELAYELKIDPIQLRERNHADYDEHEGHPWSSKSLREAYKLGAERFGWTKRNPMPRSIRTCSLAVQY